MNSSGVCLLSELLSLSKTYYCITRIPPPSLAVRNDADLNGLDFETLRL